MLRLISSNKLFQRFHGLERSSTTLGVFRQCKQPYSSLLTQAAETKSFVLSLFRGKLDTQQILPYPQVLSDGQKETVRMILELFSKALTNGPLGSLDLDALEKIPDEMRETLKDLGAYGMMVPEEYGGAGLSNTMYAQIAENSGAQDLGVNIFLGAHQSIGYKGLVLFGTPEQKQKYVPALARGDLLAAFCLTETSSGSDASSIRSRAELSPDGKHYNLNGSKIWISNGGIADVFTVFAQTPVTDPTTGVTKDKISAFIVERAFGGVTSGPPEKKMGIKCSNTTEVFFDDCKVPVGNMLLSPGDGFKIAMNILNNGRFGMVACLTGTQRILIQRATDHAKHRTQFRDKLSEFGTIQEKLARMAMVHYVSESMAFALSGVMDLGFKDFQLEAAIGKIYASEAAWYVADETLQIMGGMGFMQSAGIEKIMRDLRIFRIFEGTNEILRLFIALTGMQHAGKELKILAKALKNPLANPSLLLSEASKRIGIVRSSGSSMVHKVDGQLASPATKLDNCVHLFGITVESLLRQYGLKIVDQQFLLNRVTDSAIDIYAMACILSRCNMAIEKDEPSTSHQLLMVKSFCHEATIRVSKNLRIVKNNRDLQNFSDISQISANLVHNDGVVQDTPV